MEPYVTVSPESLLPTPYENARAMRRALSWLAAGLSLMLLGWMASLSLLFAFAGRYMTPTLELFFNDVCFYGVGFPLFLVCALRVKPEPGLKRPMRFSRLLIAFLIGAFFIEAAATATNYIMETVSELAGYDFADRIQDMSVTTPLWAIFLFVVIVAPLGEEFIFRRLLCDRLRPFGEWPAALLSALAFGLFHTNVYQIGYAFLLGLMLAFVYLKTGRLRYTVVLHAAVNFFFGFMAEVVNRYGNVDRIMDWLYGGMQGLPEIDWAGLAIYAAYLMLSNAAVVCGLVFLIVHRRRIRWEAGSRSLTRGQVALRLVRNPFVWIYLILCVGLMLSDLLAAPIAQALEHLLSQRPAV